MQKGNIGHGLFPELFHEQCFQELGGGNRVFSRHFFQLCIHPALSNSLTSQVNKGCSCLWFIDFLEVSSHLSCQLFSYYLLFLTLTPYSFKR